MTGAERDEIAQLTTRLFGIDGQTGGALADLDERISGLAAQVSAIDTRTQRWDGAITFVKTAAGIVGISGLVAIARLVGQ